MEWCVVKSPAHLLLILTSAQQVPAAKNPGSSLHIAAATLLACPRVSFSSSVTPACLGSRFISACLPRRRVYSIHTLSTRLLYINSRGQHTSWEDVAQMNQYISTFVKKKSLPSTPNGICMQMVCSFSLRSLVALTCIACKSRVRICECNNVSATSVCL